jgi:hypothetical protein
MKTKLLLSLFVAALFVFNFSFKNEKERNGSLTLQNITIMQANASEAYCDQSDDSGCAIVIELDDGGRITGNSTGNVVGWF